MVVKNEEESGRTGEEKTKDVKRKALPGRLDASGGGSGMMIYWLVIGLILQTHINPSTFNNQLSADTAGRQLIDSSTHQHIDQLIFNIFSLFIGKINNIFIITNNMQNQWCKK